MGLFKKTNKTSHTKGGTITTPPMPVAGHSRQS
jgi:hypothetical protein